MLTKKTISKDQRQLLSAEMANGRFTFHKRHLYFSLIVPEVMSAATRAPPRFLQFLSEDGSILEEQELATNDYYNATGKVYYSFSKLYSRRKKGHPSKTGR